ncbi:GTP 3',8-cyclase MoaA [Longirhabdus pacifica]|uniref:GTP 3',8-cyclase MoaA n=1 Tax=Longirhabdus pacifica TaxID=2305227 RepID=UPI0010090D6C|nr:GTP 3',8-cyclase MoaA [Longirhabdus pacifica]
MQQHQIVDKKNRPLQDLRISVTDRCNFRCPYCMPIEQFGMDYPFLEKDNILSFEELSRLTRIFAALGVNKIRITGGEPLLRKQLPMWIKEISQIEGIEDIALTTNASLLTKYVGQLKEANVNRLNISLDSLDSERFKKMNGVGFDVQSVLQAIDHASAAGFPIKINMVVKKGMNEQDILPMASYFKQKGHTLRFIEFMDVGNHNDWKLEHVLSSKQIVEMISGEMPLEPLEANYFGEVAKRYRYTDGSAEIGFISSVTNTFCDSCTRARISAEGYLYTCLFATSGHDLRSPLRDGASDEELMKCIKNIWNGRKDEYSALRSQQTNNSNKKIEMSHIGG